MGMSLNYPTKSEVALHTCMLSGVDSPTALQQPCVNDLGVKYVAPGCDLILKTILQINTRRPLCLARTPTPIPSRTTSKSLWSGLKSQ